MMDFFCKHTCIFCDTLSYRKIDLCAACESDLPTLKIYCAKCAKPLPAGQDVCGACLANSLLSAVNVTALFYYQSPVDQLIANLKFGNNLIGAKILGELLANHLYKKYQNRAKPEIIIPVPLHSSRLRERGYNQALELARPVAEKLQIPIDKFCVRRVKNTQPQARLIAKERQQNIKKAFGVIPDLNYHHVAVVDDVVTTGNTITELCKLLFGVGVKKIDVWCCAKSLFKNSANLAKDEYGDLLYSNT
jgi:ComF family protein